MQKNISSSMAEAGKFSAISVIFAVTLSSISIYIPLLGIFLNIFWHVALILPSVRYGLKWSALSLITTGLLLAIIVSPMESLFQIMASWLTVLTFGYCLSKGKPPVVSILCGTVASFVSNASVLLLSFWITGTSPLDLDFETMYPPLRFNIPEDQMEMMQLILPASFIIASILDAFVAFLAAKSILKRLGTIIPSLPPFKNWMLPKAISLFCILLLIMIFFTQGSPDSSYYRIAANAHVLFGTFLLIQGIAVCWFMIEQKGWPILFKGLLLILLIMVSYVVYFIFVFIGILDCIFDFRKIRPKNP